MAAPRCNSLTCLLLISLVFTCSSYFTKAHHFLQSYLRFPSQRVVRAIAFHQDYFTDMHIARHLSRRHACSVYAESSKPLVEQEVMKNDYTQNRILRLWRAACLSCYNWLSGQPPEGPPRPGLSRLLSDPCSEVRFLPNFHSRWALPYPPVIWIAR